MNTEKETEDQIETCLVETHNLFLQLPVQHDADLAEWVYSIHELQKLMMIRKTRRDYPERYSFKKEDTTANEND